MRGSFVEVVRSKLEESARENLLRASASGSRSHNKGPAAAVQATAQAIERASAEVEREEAREEEQEQRQQGGEGTMRRRKRKRRPNLALVAAGALTNVALLLWTRPDLAIDRKFDLYLMRAALGQDNTGVVAEFNFDVDPHAAAAVFGSAGAGKGLRILLWIPWK